MDTVSRAVLDNVEAHREELIADVSACVRIPSVVGDEGPAQAFMQALFQRLDLELDVFEADSDSLEGQPGNLRTPWPTTGRPNVVGTLAGTDPSARSLAGMARSTGRVPGAARCMDP